ncbi:ribosome 60S biogenesis N-terminal-domain-containing protein [Lipomyces japonicus]|uniref:ribosome 60S biogenesis N-terminal-domain-containing protein n=1 Tax=Lipomyces japonicus TaxID=56871 RepID=UPI0034CD0297
MSDKVLIENKENPAFAALDRLTGSIPDKVIDIQDVVKDLDLLSRELEGGLADKLIAAWAEIATKSTTSAEYINANSRLEKFLKLISNSVLLRSCGSKMIHSIIDDHIKLIYRALGTLRSNSVISTLRLLTELARFANGHVAEDIYSSFDFTLAALPKLFQPPLKPKIQDDEQQHAAKRKKTASPATAFSTTRYHVIEFFKTFISVGSSTVKVALLGQRKLIVPWFRNINSDDQAQILSTLTLLRDVVHDKLITKSVKVSFFNEWVLTRILSLYNLDTNLIKSQQIRNEAHIFLLYICTNAEYGICFPSLGWYPPGARTNEADAKGHKLHNKTLLALLKRVDVFDELQWELLHKILHQSQELVAPYLLSGSIKIDPKLDSKFVICASRLSQIIELPIPHVLSKPSERILQSPQLDVVLENILPSLLSKKILSNSLQVSNQPLITFMMVNIQVQSFLKLQKILKIYNQNEWIVAKKELQDEMFRRLPDIFQIAAVLNSLSDLQTNLRVMTARFLKLYISTFPKVTATSKIDLSQALVRLLEKDDVKISNQSLIGQNILAFKDILHIQSNMSESSKWWNKPDNRKFCLFVYLMKIAVSIESEDTYYEILSLLDNITSETLLFQQNYPLSPIYILIPTIRSFIHQISEQHSSGFWIMLDEAITRCLRTPYKYVDRVHDLSTSQNELAVSPFLVSLIEQWEHLTNSTTPYVTPSRLLAAAMVKIFALGCMSGENWTVVIKFLNKIAKSEKSNIEGYFDSVVQIFNYWSGTVTQKPSNLNFDLAWEFGYSGSKLGNQNSLFDCVTSLHHEFKPDQFLKLADGKRIEFIDFVSLYGLASINLHDPATIGSIARQLLQYRSSKIVKIQVFEYVKLAKIWSKIGHDFTFGGQFLKIVLLLKNELTIGSHNVLFIQQYVANSINNAKSQQVRN